MNIFHTSCLIILILFILRTELSLFRAWFRKEEKEILKAFAIQRPTRYEPSKYLVISK